MLEYYFSNIKVSSRSMMSLYLQNQMNLIRKYQFFALWFLLIIFRYFECSSGFSKLILGAINELCAMISEYITSLAPPIHISWPVIDFVELTGIRPLSNTL